jgi:hypothetical protein
MYVLHVLSNVIICPAPLQLLSLDVVQEPSATSPVSKEYLTRYNFLQLLVVSNVERGLEHVSLEEWTQFESVEVATNAYINHNRHRVRACAKALTHPSKSYFGYHVATQIHSRSIKATCLF